MGGGRDVKDAPSIKDYEFDEWNSTWESPDPDPLLTATNWIWSDKDSVKRWNRTAYFVDKTLVFLKKHKGQPCYINLWPDDVHTPWVRGERATRHYPGGPNEEASFKVVLKKYDIQMGRLMKGLQNLGMDKNAIVIFTSDNGPMLISGMIVLRICVAVSYLCKRVARVCHSQFGGQAMFLQAPLILPRSFVPMIFS